MKKILLYIGIFALTMLAPVQSADVGKLRPVQLISMFTKGNEIVIETDTGDSGAGETVREAFDELERTTPAIIYLDTADYLLVTESALEYVTQLDVYLKDTIRMCRQEVPVDTKQAAQYLSVHGELPRLKSWEKGADLPVLDVIEKKVFLIEKSKNNT